MPTGWGVSIVSNDIPRVRASIEEKTESAVRDSAKFFQSYAVSHAPRLTGAFAVSIYVNGPNQESDYGERSGMASELNERAVIVPELTAAQVDPQLGQLRDTVTGRFTYPQAVISSAVEYSLYLEEGTVYMSPRPTFRPAALATEQHFKSSMSSVADGF